jgi:hypothetical protein
MISNLCQKDDSDGNGNSNGNSNNGHSNINNGPGHCKPNPRGRILFHLAGGARVLCNLVRADIGGVEQEEMEEAEEIDREEELAVEIELERENGRIIGDASNPIVDSVTPFGTSATSAGRVGFGVGESGVGNQIEHIIGRRSHSHHRNSGSIPDSVSAARKRNPLCSDGDWPYVKVEPPQKFYSVDYVDDKVYG